MQPRQQSLKRQPNPQVIISVSCSKAMTLSNFKDLAKMVNKQRQKQLESEGRSGEVEVGEQNKGSFAKQKMLQSRIEKLRALESKVNKEDAFCTKKTCPVAIDPRTTAERYRNESAEGFVADNTFNKDVRARIERFRKL